MCGPLSHLKAMFLWQEGNHGHLMVGADYYCWLNKFQKNLKANLSLYVLIN